MNSFKLASAVILAGAVTFTSCKKNNNVINDNPELNTAVSVAQNDAKTSQQFNDVFGIAMGANSSDGAWTGIGTGAGIIYKPGGELSTLGAQCFTVDVVPKDLATWPKTVTIDFGTTGCQGTDGKVRKGKIIAVFSSPVYQQGATLSITLDGYSSDSFAIAGNLTVTNTGTSNHIGFKEEISGGQLTNTNTGAWYKYDGTRTETQIAGMSTPIDFSDDAYQITGNGTGSTSANFTWAGEITTPLIWKLNCRWPGQGIFTFHWNQNTDAATLNYGDGSCDNKATVSYKGFSKDITL